MSMYFVGIDISKYKHDCCPEANRIIVFSIKKGKVNYPPKNSFPKMNILS